MAVRKSRVTVPTTSALAHGDRLPSKHPAVVKALLKTSRAALLSLVLDWLSKGHQPACAPYLEKNDAEEDGDLYPAVRTLKDLTEVYQELRARKGSKKEVVDRVLEGDWRHGLTMIQLAMVDVRYLLDHPTSLKWIALKLARAGGSDIEQNDLPRFHAPTFLSNLQYEIGPLLRAHYYLTRPEALPLTLLRIQIYDVPYNGQFLLHEQHASRQGGATGTSKTVYVAFPDGAPYVYVSLATAPGQPAGGEGRNLRKMVIDAMPKAMSSPQARYAFQPTSLSAKSLSALLSLRGMGRGNGAAGGWSIFADGSVERTPLDRSVAPSTRPAKRKGLDEAAEDQENQIGMGKDEQKQQKWQKLVAKGRFGNYGVAGDEKALERLEIRIEDPFVPRPNPSSLSIPAPLGERNVNQTSVSSSGQVEGESNHHREHENTQDDDWRPQVRFVFHGTHVFAGIRGLVEMGVIDGKRMPGWMTGEAGVSVGVIRDGKIVGHKGSGL